MAFLLLLHETCLCAAVVEPQHPQWELFQATEAQISLILEHVSRDSRVEIAKT